MGNLGPGHQAVCHNLKVEEENTLDETKYEGRGDESRPVPLSLSLILMNRNTPLFNKDFNKGRGYVA